MASFSERLREAMLMKKLNISQLSEKTGISKGAISNYLSGRYSAAQSNTYKIAEALDVNEAWLMGYDDVPMQRIKREETAINKTSVIPGMFYRFESNIEYPVSKKDWDELYLVFNAFPLEDQERIITDIIVTDAHIKMEAQSRIHSRKLKR